MRPGEPIGQYHVGRLTSRTAGAGLSGSGVALYEGLDDILVMIDRMMILMQPTTLRHSSRLFEDVSPQAGGIVGCGV